MNNPNNMINKDANKQDTSRNFSTNRYNTDSKASQATKGNEGIPRDESMKIVEDTEDRLKNNSTRKIEGDTNMRTVAEANERLQTGQGMTGQDTDYERTGERSQDAPKERSSDISNNVSDSITEKETDKGFNPTRSDKVKA